ncbi:hypothetical protein FHW36_11453 [Chitinophaga polysaccharea]|uniref:Uncharacterized protein n=1 Tax=Chitinophaga polysaccharea TaxID=1293035 RepID=A0A561P3I0_9BACT|nr:hypothetical protein FHW36_11453 [Chitinophaga polysaccharea]
MDFEKGAAFNKAALYILKVVLANLVLVFKI